MAENIGGGGWQVTRFFKMHLPDCADYYVYRNGGVPTSVWGVGGQWVACARVILLYPTPFHPTPRTNGEHHLTL
jgi:hypothetical protein